MVVLIYLAALHAEGPDDGRLRSAAQHDRHGQHFSTQRLTFGISNSATAGLIPAIMGPRRSRGHRQFEEDHTSVVTTGSGPPPTPSTSDSIWPTAGLGAGSSSAFFPAGAGHPAFATPSRRSFKYPDGSAPGSSGAWFGPESPTMPPPAGPLFRCSPAFLQLGHRGPAGAFMIYGIHRHDDCQISRSLGTVMSMYSAMLCSGA